jgi:hypothetical protein
VLLLLIFKLFSLGRPAGFLNFDFLIRKIAAPAWHHHPKTMTTRTIDWSLDALGLDNQWTCGSDSFTQCNAIS